MCFSASFYSSRYTYIYKDKGGSIVQIFRTVRQRNACKIYIFLLISGLTSRTITIFRRRLIIYTQTKFWKHNTQSAVPDSPLNQRIVILSRQSLYFSKNRQYSGQQNILHHHFMILVHPHAYRSCQTSHFFNYLSLNHTSFQRYMSPQNTLL